MLYYLLMYYEAIMAAFSIAIWLAVKYWNGKHTENLPSLSPIAIFWSFFNYWNLELIQQYLSTTKLWRGDSERLSFVGALVAVICGHIALIQIRRRGTARPIRIMTLAALLCAYPYLIYWLLILLVWLRYVWLMRGYPGP